MTRVAYRAVRSRQRFNDSAGIKRRLEGAMIAEVAPRLLEKFKDVVANWDNKPDFVAKPKITPNSLSIDVYPTGKNEKIWLFVSGGTKPHEIKPKKGKVLAFQWGYSPKTSPGGGSGGSGTASGPMVFTKHVNHPGIKARNFETKISKEFAPEYKRLMESAWRSAIGG